jgi:hypothetical protein
MPPVNESNEAMLMIFPLCRSIHAGAEVATQQENSIQIRLKHQIPVLHRKLYGRMAPDRAGVVHENVDPPGERVGFV